MPGNATNILSKDTESKVWFRNKTKSEKSNIYT